MVRVRIIGLGRENHQVIFLEKAKEKADRIQISTTHTTQGPWRCCQNGPRTWREGQSKIYLGLEQESQAQAAFSFFIFLYVQYIYVYIHIFIYIHACV